MQKRITKQMDQDKDVARQLLNDGKKDRALLLLRKKKRMEQKLTTLDSQLANLEQMVADIEFAQIEIQVVDGLKVGNEALKELNQLLSIESIETILEETHEAAAKQKVILLFLPLSLRLIWTFNFLQELTDLLSGTQEGEDEASLLAELESLVEAETPALPAVPQEEPQKEEPGDEKETQPVQDGERTKSSKKRVQPQAQLAS